MTSGAARLRLAALAVLVGGLFVAVALLVAMAVGGAVALRSSRREELHR